MFRISFIEKVTSEQILEDGKGSEHGGIWRNNATGIATALHTLEEGMLCCEFQESQITVRWTLGHNSKHSSQLWRDRQSYKQ